MAAVILEPRKIKSATVSIASPSIWPGPSRGCADRVNQWPAEPGEVAGEGGVAEVSEPTGGGFEDSVEMARLNCVHNFYGGAPSCGCG